MTRPRSIIVLIFSLIAPIGANAQAVDCDALRAAVIETEAAVDAAALDESTRRALTVRSELLLPGAKIRLFPESFGIDDRALDLRALAPAFNEWRAVVDQYFVPELEAQQRFEEAEGPWAEAEIALSEAVKAGDCGR